ncbi:unnamed protein product [Closterium sp. NIES-54]
MCFETSRLFSPAPSHFPTLPSSHLPILSCHPLACPPLQSGGSGYDLILGGAGRDALFGGHNVDILYGGGWGNWITGGDSADKIYVDAPKSCQATGPAPDIINDYDTDKIFIVGSLTSLSQLSIATIASGTTIALKGCAAPFIFVRGVSNLPTSNIFFTTLDGIPTKP